nr:YjbF family lipoprotein [Phaeobacter inhibens]
MLCSRRDLGAGPIEIVELRYPTRHIEERCRPSQPGRGGEIINDYWVDSRSGRVWQSRQWAGPNVGYLRIRQLTTGS